MKSKLMLTLVALTMAIALVAGGTMAWFTAEADAPEAIFTAGTVNVDVAITDEFYSGEMTAFNLTNWNPGDTTIVRWLITNTGSKAMVFRLLPDVTVVQGARGAEFGPIPSPWNGENLRGEFVSLVERAKYEIVTGLDNRNWNEHIYYRLVPLAAGETVELAMAITLKGPETTNVYQGATFTIGGTIEVVQASNNAPNTVFGVNFYPQP